MLVADISHNAADVIAICSKDTGDIITDIEQKDTITLNNLDKIEFLSGGEVCSIQVIIPKNKKPR